MPLAGRTTSTIHFIVFCYCFCCLAQVDQSHEIEWRVDDSIDQSDRIAIIKLAKQLGMPQPIRVKMGITRPVGCRNIAVESPIVEVGNHRSWLELSMRAQDWEKCSEVQPGAIMERVGRWVASSSNLIKRENWRIKDDEWFVDLYLRYVSYADAGMIVRAIRRGELINRLSDSIPDRAIPDVDPNDIFQIRGGGGQERTYKVFIGKTGNTRGLVFDVRIVNNQVELIDYSGWIV